MWVKGLILVAVLGIAGGAVVAYNRAIEKAERLDAANQILQESVKQQTQARLLAEKVLVEREATVEVIYETEIKTIEVIKEVQGECLDVRMPNDLLNRLRDRESGLSNKEDLPSGAATS